VMFRMAAVAFLRFLDRFCVTPVSPPFWGRFLKNDGTTSSQR
jgi:hypothetical protein